MGSSVGLSPEVVNALVVRSCFDCLTVLLGLAHGSAPGSAKSVLGIDDCAVEVGRVLRSVVGVLGGC